MSLASKSPEPRSGILDIAAYVPGKEHAPGVAKVHKLSSNETPLGASPSAIEAFQAAAFNLERYPDGQARALRGVEHGGLVRRQGLRPHGRPHHAKASRTRETSHRARHRKAAQGARG